MLLVAFAGCGHTAYPADVKSNFLASCEEQAPVENDPPRECHCALGKIEGALSLQELKEAEAGVRLGEKPPKSMIEAAAACTPN
ncbi:MAG: hypothetical protein ACRDLF_11150 [Solirubrobacteraceae bacterium]